MAKNASEIPMASMADIAFMLLIFFLVATTMDVDSGITRKLPPPPPDSPEDIPEIKERNIFKILINSRDNLLVEGQIGDITMLKEQTKEFINNPSNREDLPEKKLESIPLLGDIWVSKGIISLKNDRGTSYDMYIQVQNELAAAINELRDELSMDKFGLRFSLLTEDQSEAIQKAIPVAISEAEPEDVGGN
ncbi:MAG: biopolymer transporter ExbD [Bacteroidales bacterium]|nr:biopolymer transporter ExbD [Bacteroidales bacterium]